MTGLARRHLLVPVLLVALAATAYLVWLVRVELVVIFGALLFGIGLYTLAQWLHERTGLSHRASVIIWYLGAILLAVGFFFFAGQRLTDEYGELSERLPAALEKVQEGVEGVPILESLGDQIEEMGGGGSEEGQQGQGGQGQGQEGGAEGGGQEGGGQSAAQDEQDRRMQVVRLSFRALSLFVVWAVLVFFIAFDGKTYAGALLQLVPPEHRAVGRDLVQSMTTALPWWLVGRVSSMGVVTLLTAPGLLLLGVPLAFVLALLAGLFSFVPFVGPIAAVIPAALVALESAPSKLVWVLVLYGTVQFLETNVITPRIQQYVASVPPVLLITSQLLMGVFVGIVGVMFATPLALAAMVAVQVVYVRHTLGEEVSTPHEDDG